MAEAVATPGAVVDKRLQALEAQAEDLNEARKALESAVNIGRGLWFTFLSLSAYLVISVGAVTHRDLFLETPVRLPLLNAELPMVTFFWVAPLMYLTVHGYLLLHLRFMGDNARFYFGLVDKTGLDEAAKSALFLQLPNFIILQMMLARRAPSWNAMSYLIHTIVVLTVIIGPILVLLLIQLQFLPYHSIGVTFVQRAAIIVDMVLVLYFWPDIAGPTLTKLVRLYRSLVWAVMLVIMLFSGLVATFPGEANYNVTFFRQSALAEFLFRGSFDEVTGKRSSWFSDTLALSNSDFVDLDDDRLAKADHTISLRGRNLQEANLSRADLRGGDFSGANLLGANLKGARLQRAKFECPSSQIIDKKQTITRCANLQSAILDEAQLNDASLKGARLQYANLSYTQLERAILTNAKLQGTSITNAKLAGAQLQYANLTASRVLKSNLTGANLEEAFLYGTLLSEVDLQKANLKSAKMPTATLVDVNVFGVEDGGVDWQTTVVKRLRSADEKAPERQPQVSFEVSGLAGNPPADQSDGNNAGGADPSEKAGAISKIAISDLANGLIENDPVKWKLRVDRLVDFICRDDYGVDVLQSVATIPTAKEDKLIQFGPDRVAAVSSLLDPSRDCKNQAELKKQVELLVKQWTDEGAAKAAKP